MNQRFVILGGGTAGWIAASYLDLWRRGRTDVEITVVESSEIGIVGTGEGATLQLRRFCELLGISDSDLIRQADATFKLGICFTDWGELGQDYFNPFNNAQNPMFFDRFGNHVDLLNVARVSSGHPKATQVNLQCSLMRVAKSPWLHGQAGGPLRTLEQVPITGDSGLHNAGWGYSFHFSGHKIGQMLKRRLMGRDVRVIDAVVDSAERSPSRPDEIGSVRLNDGRRVEGDFFIDCSGFRRLLVGNSYEVPWISWSRHLINNSAIPFLLDHAKGPMQSYTGAYALSSGWMWEIPTRERRGCGYVFNRDLLSPEAAVAEIEARLGCAIEPIQHIKFDAGRLREHWVGNCVAVGLASNFAEPLEATSIHTTITQMHLLTMNLAHQRPASWSGVAAAYNTTINEVLDGVRDFLALHYVSRRTDSPYWRSLGDRAFLPESLRDKLELWKHRFPCVLDFRGNPDLHPFGLPSYVYVLDGLGLLRPSGDELALAAAQRDVIASIEERWGTRTRELCDSAIDHRELVEATWETRH